MTLETSDFGQVAVGATGTRTTVTAVAATSATATLTLRPVSGGGTAKVTYARDATNRIVERNVNDVTVARYTFSGSGDTPDAELDVTNVIQRRTLGLMGGAVLSKAAGSEIWSISNLHGDTIATLGSTGVVTGGPFTHDPFGKAIGGVPDNQIGSFDNGWLGKDQRPLEQQSGLRAVIVMGARIYDPVIGRFLSTDPVEGGTANDYAYVEDPINQFDLTGMCSAKKGNWLRRRWCNVQNVAGGGARNTGRAARWTYRRTDVSGGVCLFSCVFFGQQGGNIYIARGGGPILSAGLGVGIASKQYKDRNCQSSMSSFGPLSTYGGLGGKSAWKDFELAVGKSMGGGFGTLRVPRVIRRAV